MRAGSVADGFMFMPCRGMMGYDDIWKTAEYRSQCLAFAPVTYRWD